jgi:hypothetical protein
MKRIALFVLGVLAISRSPSAQAPAEAIATALLGLPANVREGATVIKWKPDQTYDTLQKGTAWSATTDRVFLSSSRSRLNAPAWGTCLASRRI